MNIKTLIAAALAIGSASAFAVEATQVNIEPTVLTRAEVRADLAQANAAGELNVRGETYGSFAAKDLAPATRQLRAPAQAHVTLPAVFNRDYIGG